MCHHRYSTALDAAPSAPGKCLRHTVVRHVGLTTAVHDIRHAFIKMFAGRLSIYELPYVHRHGNREIESYAICSNNGCALAETKDKSCILGCICITPSGSVFGASARTLRTIISH